ncbi:MAG: hypothetical protein NZM15_04100 [Flavobacteriales bacterium]|nr:hypothetical protein [Flavobacteriales bacterium]MDW8431867.1 hypothetical protein [Flavobacteriales bacterium]
MKEWRLLFGIPPYGQKEQFITNSLVLPDGSSIHALVHEVTYLGCDYPHYGLARVSKDGQLLWIKPACIYLPHYDNIQLYQDYLGRYLLAGSTHATCLGGTSITGVYCMDSTGAYHYCRAWGGSFFVNQIYSVSFTSGAPTRDGGFVFAGSQYITGYGLSPNSGSGNYLFRLGPQGDSLWKVRNFIPDSAFPAQPNQKQIRINDVMENQDSSISVLAWIRIFFSSLPEIKTMVEIRLDKEGRFLFYRPLLTPPGFWDGILGNESVARYFLKPKNSDRKILMCNVASDQPGYDRQMLLEYDTSGAILWSLNLYRQENRGEAFFMLPDTTVFSIITFPNGYIGGKPAFSFYSKRWNLSGNILGEKWTQSDWKAGGLWNNPRTILFPQSLKASTTTPDSCIIIGGTGKENAQLTSYERGIYYVEKRCRDVFLNNHDVAEGGEAESANPLLDLQHAGGALEPAVYPNPGAGQYHISHGLPVVRLRVWDSRGVLALDVRPSEGRFSLEGRPAGLYLWEATDMEGRVHRGRLVQQAAQ